MQILNLFPLCFAREVRIFFVCLARRRVSFGHGCLGLCGSKVMVAHHSFTNTAHSSFPKLFFLLLSRRM